MNRHPARLRLLPVLLLVSGTLFAQPAGSFSERSYARAREVLARGMQALGGQKNFDAIEDVRFKSHATYPEVGQSASPDAAFYLRPQDTEGILDLAHRRYSIVRKTNYLGSGPRGNSVVTNDKTGFTADIRSGAVYPLAPGAVTANSRAVLRTLPWLLVQLALNRPGTLRWMGEGEYAGRKQDVISFVDSDGSQYTLFFDARSGLLTKTEGLTDSFVEGLKTSETVYSDYRTTNGVAMPFHVVSRVGNETQADLTYSEITFNTHPDARLFDMPAGAEMGPVVGGPRQPITVTPLGKDVWFIDAIETGGIFFYSSLFVAFKDHVLVMEAPLNDNVTQAIIAKIKETVPGKPIRYVVPTHYHVDHTGGIRGYVAEGTTIVTTPGNRRFFESIAAVQHPLNPDRLSLQPRPISIETFADKRVITDGDQTVELYNIGPTSHVQEMVLAYLPRLKLAFVSDLFLVSYKGTLGPAEPGNIMLNDKIRALGLQIETFAGGHGRIGTMEELKQVVGGGQKE
jgi:glyoxylase-like metal-dependent hydrolase (beta-lactamase superfamily II)